LNFFIVTELTQTLQMPENQYIILKKKTNEKY